MSVDLALRADAEVGEAPVWEPRDRRLHWVDAIGKKIHSFDPSTGIDLTADAGTGIGSIALRREGGLVVCGSDGFSTSSNGEVRLRATVEGPPGHALSDCGVDSAGRLWAGSYSLDPDGSTRPGGGALYRVGESWEVERTAENLTLSNGMGWSTDDRSFYFIDSASDAMDVFEFDVETGTVGPRNQSVDFSADAGMPDGLAIDSEDMAWVAFWGGSEVRRFDTSGRLIGRIQLPVSQVTNCCFGGDDLQDLYITTASFGLSHERIAAEPLAGSVFVVRLDVPGRPSNLFAG